MTATRTATETDAYAAMLQRMIRAYGRRLVDGDPADLAQAVALRAELDTVIADSVASSRTRWSWSWAQIGSALGVSRQYAQQKYGSK